MPESKPSHAMENERTDISSAQSSCSLTLQKTCSTMCPPAKETATRQQLRSLSMQERGRHWPIIYVQETAKTKLNTQKQCWSERGRESSKIHAYPSQHPFKAEQHNTKDSCSCRQRLLNHAKERTSQSCRATRQTSDNPQSQQWRLASQTKTERTA